jgi:hypothetical protein
MNSKITSSKSLGFLTWQGYGMFNGYNRSSIYKNILLTLTMSLSCVKLRAVQPSLILSNSLTSACSCPHWRKKETKGRGLTGWPNVVLWQWQIWREVPCPIQNAFYCRVSRWGIMGGNLNGSAEEKRVCSALPPAFSLWKQSSCLG